MANEAFLKHAMSRYAMDFTVRPPEGFELGHTQDYYEGEVPNFFLTDAFWGKTFRGGVRAFLR